MNENEIEAYLEDLERTVCKRQGHKFRRIQVMPYCDVCEVCSKTRPANMAIEGMFLMSGQFYLAKRSADGKRMYTLRLLKKE